MARTLLNILVLLIAIAAGIYQFYLQPFFKQFGHGRVIEALNNNHCIRVPELTACEKLVLHPPTGNLYLSCSTPESRVHWTPTVDRLNAAAASRTDYVAVYTPPPPPSPVSKSKATPAIAVSLFTVWTSSPPKKTPPNSTSTSSTTVPPLVTNLPLSEAIITPNDLVGSPDGKSFWFTNDHGEKTGFKRQLDMFLGRKSTSVGYCHIDNGCKLAITRMHGNNGIAQAPNGTIYVANSLWGGLSILEPQSDNSLVLVDHIKTDRGMDNVSVDSNGYVWAAAFSNAFALLKYFGDPTYPSPSSALRFSINTGPNAFYGEKYKIEKLFEDDGSLASGITSVVYDAERNRLFLDGLSSPQLVVCEL
ncbi:hypothetical protein BDQ17DRAFT_1387867 [Cyathus striatus]|nr:hypothetical protein BDQ17DRAFT_1387867 [Cyathus striatus]